MKLLLLLLSSLIVPCSYAASCCGGGSAFPGVITGDYKGQFTTTISQSQIVADAQSGAYFKRTDSNADTARTLTLQGARMISEFLQTSVTLPIIERRKSLSQKEEVDAGLGDMTVSLNYEILPELTYSKWKPRGFGFLSAHLPLAPSKFEDSNSLKTEARGDGFYGLTAGVLFTKLYKDLDLLAGSKYRYRLNRTIHEKSIKPGASYTFMFGIGHNFKNSPWRIGINSLTEHTEVFHINSNEFQKSTSSSDIWTTSLMLNYLVNSELMLAASYNDQTFLGPSRNTPLERSISIQAQKRWSL